MSGNYWIKLYIEIIDDPKMAVLPDRLWRRVIELFLLAGKMGENGLLPTTSQLAWLMRMNTDELELDMQQLSMTGIIESIPNGWLIPKFKERQAPISSTNRSREFRKKERSDQYAGETNKVCGIYKIECLSNGKVYIGSSKDATRRIKDHFYNGETFADNWMHDDLLEFGRGAFTAEIIETINNTDTLPERETYWINQYKGKLYNAEKSGKYHRERMPATEVQRNVAQINRLTDTESYTESYTESESDHSDDDGGSVSTTPNIFQLYEQNIGIVQPILVDELKEAEKEYPAQWIQEAFLEAANRNARNWKYISKILANRKLGYQPGRNGKNNDIRRDTVEARNKYAEWER